MKVLYMWMIIFKLFYWKSDSKVEYIGKGADEDSNDEDEEENDHEYSYEEQETEASANIKEHVSFRLFCFVCLMQRNVVWYLMLCLVVFGRGVLKKMVGLCQCQRACEFIGKFFFICSIQLKM